MAGGEHVNQLWYKVGIVVVALQLASIGLGGAEASCTAVNRSDKAMQITVTPIVLSRNASASGGQKLVSVAAGATVTFTLNGAPSAIMVFANQASQRVSAPHALADRFTLLFAASATVPGAVDVSLAFFIGTAVTPVFKLINGL